MDVDRTKTQGLSVTLRLLWSLMWRERLLSTGWILSLLAAAAATLAVPIAVRHVIDHGFSSTSGINSAFGLLLVIALILATTTAARLYFVSYLGDRVVSNLRKNLFGQLIRRDLDFHHDTRSAELLSRLTTDSEHLRLMVGAALSVALRSIVTIVGCVVMLLATNATLTGWAVVAILLAVIPIIVHSRKLRNMSRESQDFLASATTIASEVLGAIRTTMEFVRETHEESRYRRAIEDASGSEHRRVLAQAMLAAVAIGLVFGAVIVVMWIGAREVAAHRMTAGMLGQFIVYAVIGGSAVAELLETWSTIQRSVGAVGRVTDLYQFNPAVQRSMDVEPIAPVIGSIEFDGVDFAYKSMPGKRVLKDFSLQVAPGECVALVGPSGAGKSTVFSLLLQLYDMQRGRILVDGKDLRFQDPARVRELIAIVPQSPTIFAMSARENIRYGRLDATDEEVEAAAVAAEADEFIQALPGRYDEPLGERGVRLSGGQQQRIAIARAMLKNAPILLLDEATSALDAQSERLVHAALQRVRAGRTTLIIAHRLSTVLDADHIVVLDRGSVADKGPHGELMQRGGMYADLAKLQFIATTIDA